VSEEALLSLASSLARSDEASLTTLELIDCQLTANSVLELSKSLSLSKLSTLALDGVCLSKNQASEVTKAFTVANRLSHLSLRRFSSPDGGFDFSFLSSLPSLRTLEHSDSKLGDESALSIATALAQTRLTALNLSQNSFTSSSTIALLQAAALSSVSCLSLRGCVEKSSAQMVSETLLSLLKQADRDSALCRVDLGWHSTYDLPSSIVNFEESLSKANVDGFIHLR
jgi:hypothetical protein